MTDLFAERLRLAPELLRLRRGDEEILVNAGYHRQGRGPWGRPFYVRRGRERVAALLEAAVAAPSLGALLDARPDDGGLLRLLVDHGVLVAGAPPPAPATADAAPLLAEGASLYLLLSQSCNFACTYCLAGERSYGEGKPPRMDLGTAFAAIGRAAARIRPGGRLEVVFFGGEPLLNWETARAILLHSRTPAWRELVGEHACHFHFTTNLSVLPDELVAMAREHDVSFLVDVDGPARLHDRTRQLRGGGPTHALIAANLARLARAGLAYALRATVTTVNVGEMVEVARHHRELGGRSSALVAVSPVNSDETLVPLELLPEPDAYAEGLRRVHAEAGWSSRELFPFNEHVQRVASNHRMIQACGAPYGNTPVCDSRGDVYPCIYWVGIPRLHAGNILDGSYGRSPIHAQLFERLHVDRLARCCACAWRYLCGGGCPAREIALDGHRQASAAVTAYADAIPCVTAKTVLELLLWEEADKSG